MKNLFCGIFVMSAVLGLLVGCTTDEESGATDPTDAQVSGDGVSGDATVGETVSTDAGPEEVAEALYGTCTETFTCVFESCEDTDDFSCIEPCVAGSSEDAAGSFDVFFQCMVLECFEGECAGEDAPDACVDRCMKGRCTHELLACLDPGTFGEGDCFSGMECLESCDPGGPGDEGLEPEEFPCVGACLGDLQDGEKEAMAELLSCIGDAEFASHGHPTDPFGSCFEETLQCLTHGVTGDANCVDIISCMDTCGSEDSGDEGDDDDMNCIGDCFAAATADAQSTAADVFGCFDQQSPPPGGPGGMEPGMDTFACLEAFCPEEFNGCFSDLACVAAAQCMDNCGGEPNCEDGCLLDLSDETLAALEALGDCGELSGCLGADGGPGPDGGPGGPPPGEGGDPIFGECLPFLVTCAAPSNDDATCADFLACLDPGADEVAEEAPADEAPEEEDGGLGALLQCMSVNSAQAVEDFTTASTCHETCMMECGGPMGPPENFDSQPCIEMACETELGACYADTDCLGAVICMNTCDGPDEVCEEECQGDLNEESKTLLAGVLVCALANDCLAADDPEEGEESSCLAEACGTELQACIADTACKGAMDCSEACDEDENAAEDCHDQCVAAISAESAALFTATVECAIASDCWAAPGSGPGPDPGPGPCIGECLSSATCGPAIDACGYLAPDGPPASEQSPPSD